MGAKNEADENMGICISLCSVFVGLACAISMLMISTGTDGYAGAFHWPLLEMKSHAEVARLPGAATFFPYVTKKDIINAHTQVTFISLRTTICDLMSQYLLSANSLSGTAIEVIGGTTCDMDKLKSDAYTMETESGSGNTTETTDWDFSGVMLTTCAVFMTCQYVQECRTHAQTRCSQMTTMVYGGVFGGLFFLFIGVNMALATALFIQCEPSKKKSVKKRKQARLRSLVASCGTCCTFLTMWLLFWVMALAGYSFTGAAFIPTFVIGNFSYGFLGGVGILMFLALINSIRYASLKDKDEGEDDEWYGEGGGDDWYGDEQW
ncbi:unnamed protein product [Amoebophrya sp. A120]|nr:unnamed protein product [Amoebophrya sp. A120]|eukprot:GSA120T00010724001.1